eukprot:361035-Chlamydomonas_euryale.AAC.2
MAVAVPAAVHANAASKHAAVRGGGRSGRSSSDLDDDAKAVSERRYCQMVKRTRGWSPALSTLILHQQMIGALIDDSNIQQPASQGRFQGMFFKTSITDASHFQT